MRTTLTIDDDLMRELHEKARRSGKSLKEVVNEAIRIGLTTGAKPPSRSQRFKVIPEACGFRPGIDITKLNRLLDELDLERVATVVIRDK